MSEVCTMMKAQDTSAKKIPLHKVIYLEEKIDGVPGPTLLAPPRSIMVSRQGKPITSATHVRTALVSIWEKLPSDMQARVGTVVGELKVPGMPFEESAGCTRAKREDERQVFYLFDIDCQLPYKERRAILEEMNKIAGTLGITCVQRPHQYGAYTMHSLEEAERFIENIHRTVVRDGLEGMMLRPADGLYFVGKRSWDMQRLVLTPTIDLRVVGFEEAKSAGGAPLGMVGKVIVERNGKTEGVGPGKLTHDERRALWTKFTDKPMLGGGGGWKPRIAKIKYKGGETANYKSLRQATFQCWHGDKSEPDA